MRFKKIITALLAVAMLVGVAPLPAFAAWGEGDTLEGALAEIKVSYAATTLDWLLLDGFGKVSLRYTYFLFNDTRYENPVEHPVYCIDPEKGGAREIVEGIGGLPALGSDDIGVNTTTYIRSDTALDDRLRIILSKGYPHNTLGSLGLQTNEEGYYATKTALWMYIRGKNENDISINPAYGDSDPVALRVLAAAKSIYHEGMLSAAALPPQIVLTGKPSAQATLDANGEYYVQEIEVFASRWMGMSPDACGPVALSWDSPPPAGTIVLGTNGEDITASMNVEVSWVTGDKSDWYGKATVKFPAADIDPESFTPPTLSASALMANDALYIAYAKVDKERYLANPTTTVYQRYLVEGDPKIDVAAAPFELRVTYDDTITDEIEVGFRKVEYGTEIGLPGAVFRLTQLSHWEQRLVDPDEDDSGEFYDDDNGDVLDSGDPGYHHNVEDLEDDVWEWIEVRETEVVGTFVSGADGTVPVGELEAGSYTIEEITPPAGYALSEDVSERIQSFDIPREGGYTANIVFTNKKLPELTVQKVDEATGLPLSGAEFSIKLNGNTISEGVTDSAGTISVGGYSPGWYEVTETVAPPGYVKTSETKSVYLAPGESARLEFTNKRKPTLTIVKYDELTNQPLAGANFRLWKTEGETWSEVQATGADGRYTWTDLDPGIYSVQEVDEPFGYHKDTTRKEILLNGGDNKVLEFFNRPRPVLTILKRDAVTQEPIKGTKFRVQRLEGETIGEFLTDDYGKITLSPQTGFLLTDEVYRVTEITPPNEYLLGENHQTDVRLKWYEPTELIFENLLKPTLIFIKRDGLSGRGITNATYSVSYESPNGGVAALGSYKTKCGIIAIPYVTPGWYSLTETKAAPGYSLPTNPTVRLYLAPGQNSYTYAQTTQDLYVDPRTNPNNGTAGMCAECGYLCGQLCGGNCASAGTSNGGITITNGYGEPLGTAAQTPADTTAPTITAGTVTRTSDTSATVRFRPSEAGRYYFAVVNAGAGVPSISTNGAGTACYAAMTALSVSLTAGAKDFYIKVKDASGNVSGALKIAIPAYIPPSEPEPPETEEPPGESGGVDYINPGIHGITIKIGNKTYTY